MCFSDDILTFILSLAGQMVYTVRQRCGRQLAKEAAVEADIVSTVPESATPAALGFSLEVSHLNCLRDLHS